VLLLLVLNDDDASITAYVLASALTVQQQFDYEDFVLIAVALHAYAHLCACIYLYMRTLAMLVA
jgi:hypothetical protein